MDTSFLNEENTYICVRTPKSINLFLNDIFIKKIIDTNGDFYINFKIMPLNLIKKTHYIIATLINKDLSEYSVRIFDIFTENKENQEELIKILPKEYCEFQVQLEENQSNDRSIFLANENNDEKYNIGHILFWEEDYLIIGTPFNFLHILDYKKYKNNNNYLYNEPVGIINNEEKMRKKDDKNEDISDIITYNISERIEDPDYGSCFIMRDNKGKIQYIRTAIEKDKLNYQIKKPNEYYNEISDEVKLKRINFSAKFYLIYWLISFFPPLITGICGHYIYIAKFDDTIVIIASFFYLFYLIIGFFFKMCIYDITDTTHSKRKITRGVIYFLFAVKVCTLSIIAFRICQYDKNAVIFIIMLNVIFVVHLIFNFIVYIFHLKYLLKTYLLEFLFYQISRFCIILFFIISIFFKATYLGIYIYAAILCIILIYMFYVNYYNYLRKDIVYESILQAVFNFPFEWENLFCCCCIEPKVCIKKIDFNFCPCEFFLYEHFCSTCKK